MNAKMKARKAGKAQARKMRNILKYQRSLAKRQKYAEEIVQVQAVKEVKVEKQSIRRKVIKQFKAMFGRAEA